MLCPAADMRLAVYVTLTLRSAIHAHLVIRSMHHLCSVVRAVASLFHLYLLVGVIVAQREGEIHPAFLYSRPMSQQRTV